MADVRNIIVRKESIRSLVASMTLVISILLLLAACGGTGDTPPVGNGATPAPTVPPEVNLEDVWRGKTVTISVGYAAGGGADVISRLLQVHMRNYLPGNPNIVVENRPGGGTATNAQDMLRRPNDGTYIGLIAQSLMVSGVMGQAGDWFDWTSYGYVGMADGAQEESLSAICAHADRIPNLDAFLAGGPWRMGEISPETGAGRDLRWLELTDFPIRGFFGYGGSAEVAAGFDRGEMDITSRCTETEALRYPDWFESGEVIPVFGWGGLDPDNHIPPDNVLSNGIRNNQWPWFCDMRECLRHLATDDQWEAWLAFYALGGTHVFATPPGVPDHVLEALQQAFWETTNSEGFRADMAQRDRVVAPLSGEDTRARVQRLEDLPPAARAVLEQMLAD